MKKGCESIRSCKILSLPQRSEDFALANVLSVASSISKIDGRSRKSRRIDCEEAGGSGVKRRDDFYLDPARPTMRLTINS
jgi:hypothetical protein